MAKSSSDQLLAILKDPELREEAVNVLNSARSAARDAREFQKKLPKRERKKIEKAQLKDKLKKKPEPATEETAPVALAEQPKKRHRLRKLAVVAVAGGAVVVAASEDARKALFGGR